MSFSALGINKELVKALKENKITTPTEVQEKVIPHLLNGDEDLIGIAQTGTGKTAAYGLPILQNIDAGTKEIQALILVPTRELGQQVARQFFLYSKYCEQKIFAEAVYGGKPIADQVSKLNRGAHILVATPGRLIELIDMKAVNFDFLTYLVLDEADEMLNMGFKPDIDRIIRACKGFMTTLLFSATMPKDIRQMIKTHMSPRAKEIQIQEEEFVNKNISHQYIEYEDRQKLAYLKAFLLKHVNEKGILFSRTKAAAIRLNKQLAGFKVKAAVLHKDLNQDERDKVMRAIKKDRIQLLVATDIAARGIDIADVDYVINYHLPEKAIQYTHRVGRTARAGKTGYSVCFISDEDYGKLDNIKNHLKINFKEIEIDVDTDDNKSKSAYTFYINLGKAQGFTPEDLVDFLAMETALPNADFKVLKVDQQLSTFMLDGKYEDQLIANLKGMKKFHRNIKVSKKEKEALMWGKSK
ncbi:MAG: DEAD/DEAH box helicase [Hyphomicrobiales bacterium]